MGKGGFILMEIEGSIVDATIKLPPTMVVEGQVAKGHQFG
jgi:hypothetical protein